MAAPVREPALPSTTVTSATVRLGIPIVSVSVDESFAPLGSAVPVGAATDAVLASGPAVAAGSR